MTILAKSKGTPKVKNDETEIIDSEESLNEIAPEEKTDSVPDMNDNDKSVKKDNAEDSMAIERDKYLRLAAEYDNYRKRSAKEREMIYTDARTDAISKLLPVYDNLERALKMECSDEAYYKGVEMIMTQLKDALNAMGVKEIPAIGESFDPNRHNAVMSIADPSLGENIIAEEYQKGFILGDRVIRFSTVVVAN